MDNMYLMHIRNELRIANFRAYSQRFWDICEKFPPEVLADDFVLNPSRVSSSYDLDELMKNMFLYFDLCREEWSLYFVLEVADMRVWEMWKVGIKGSMNRPAFRQAWEQLKGQFECPSYPGFVQFMDSIK